MKKILFYLSIIFLTVCTNSQAQNDLPVFHRLLLLNDQNELMIVKIENRDFWVTPGWYQTQEQSIKSGLDSIASTYGIELKDLKLKGTFLLKRNLNGKRSSSLRNVYTAHVKEITLKKPNGIEYVKWLPVDKAMETITFPHINIMVQQIMENPQQVWGGTLLQYKEKDQWNVKIVESFYPL